MLTPMRFKTFVFPHNPRVYEMSYKRTLALSKVPFGAYTIQDMGRTGRVLRGEGEFYGAGAYDMFKSLATVFYENSPGTLTHPLWNTTTAYLAELKLKQEPLLDYVWYEFEFWECYDKYDLTLKSAESLTDGSGAAASAPSGADSSVPSYHTVKSGETLWSVANLYAATVTELLAKNPQIKNPNLIYPGDELLVS